MSFDDKKSKILVEEIRKSFKFPKEYSNSMVLYSYLGFLIMSKFVPLNEKNEDTEYEVDYYSTNKEIEHIIRNIIDPSWIKKDISIIFESDIKELNKELYKMIEDRLIRFGAILNLSSNAHMKRLYTNNITYKYNDVNFKVGLPSKINAKIAGFVTLSDESENSIEYNIDNGIDIEFLINYLREQMYELDEPHMKVLCCDNKGKGIKKFIDSLDDNFDLTLGRKNEFQHNVYYLIEKKNGNLRGYRLDDKSYLKKNDYHLKFYAYFFRKNGNPLKARIFKYGDSCFLLKLPFYIGEKLTAELSCLGTPEDCYFDKTKFVIRNEFKALIKDILEKNYFEVIES